MRPVDVFIAPAIRAAIDGVTPPVIVETLARVEAHGRYPVEPGELSVALLADEEHCQLHQQFLSDPAPTDVITFPGDPAQQFAGEICLNVDQARREAVQRGISLGMELALYLVHGWLHLAGWDDQTEADRSAMRKAEQELLAVLHDPDAALIAVS